MEQTARNINGMERTLQTKYTARFWFQPFRAQNFDLQNEPRPWSWTMVNNGEFKAIMEANNS